MSVAVLVALSLGLTSAMAWAEAKIGFVNSERLMREAPPAVAAQKRLEKEFEPRDRELEKVGYDIESRAPDGTLRFIEVKGRMAGAETITVTKNEILTSLNKPDEYILAMVEFRPEGERVHYLRQPFRREPDFGVTSVNYDFAELLARAGEPV